MRPDGIGLMIASDVDSLRPLVDAAGRAGDLRGGSEPRADALVRFLALDPQNVGIAWENDVPVGFVSPEFKVLVVAADQRRRGLGRRLVDAGVAIERDRGRPNLLLGPPPDREDSMAFLRATGFAYHSTLWDLALPADAYVPPPSWPDDVTARAFDRSRDVEDWVAMFNTAFREHPTPIQLEPASVMEVSDQFELDDADLLLVEDRSSRELVAFCSTAPRRSHGAVGNAGEIWTIGVRPDRQGQGLGRQLVRWGVRRLREVGVTHIGMSVNARNERALRLYEGEGFTPSSVRERWARPVA
jgi:mycothiol synthase